MTIQLVKATYISGSVAAAGSQHTLSTATEAYLVNIGVATWVGGAPDVTNRSQAFLETDASGNTVLVGAGGNTSPVGRRKSNTIALVGDSITSQNYAMLTVTGVVRLSNVLTVTTSGAHGLFAGAIAALHGVQTDMEGVYTVLSVPSSVTFTVANVGADATGTLGSFPRAQNRQRYMDNGWFVWGNTLASQKFELVGVAANSGRLSSEVMEHIDAVLTLEPAYVAVLIGTNDVTTSVPSATTITNLQTIYSAILNSGAHVIALTLIPTSGAYWSASVAEATLEINNWIKQYARENDGVLVVDAYSALVNPMASNKGEAATNMLHDGAHPSALGAFKMGTAFNAATATLQYVDTRVASNADNYGTNASNQNIFDSAPWVNSGGTTSAPASGTTPTGWVSELTRAGAATMTVSAPARADGFGYNINVVVDPEDANDRPVVRTAGGSYHSRIVAGQEYCGELSMTVSGLSGSNYSRFYAYVSGTVDGASNVYLGASLYPSGTTLPTTDWGGVMKTPPFKITGAITASSMYVDPVFSAAGTALTYAFGRAAIRKQ